MKCVYCLDFPDGKRYVGSTANLKKRLLAHNCPSVNKNNTNLKAAILNGYEVVILEVLPDTATKKDLFKREKHHIDLWWDYDILYNESNTPGAAPCRKGIKQSAEHKAKRSAARKHRLWQHAGKIRALRAAGVPYYRIAKDYNCGYNAIRRICLS